MKIIWISILLVVILISSCSKSSEDKTKLKKLPIAVELVTQENIAEFQAYGKK